MIPLNSKNTYHHPIFGARFSNFNLRAVGGGGFQTGAPQPYKVKETFTAWAKGVKEGNLPGRYFEERRSMAGTNWIISPSRNGWHTDQIVIPTKSKCYLQDKENPQKLTEHEQVNYAKADSTTGNPFSLQRDRIGAKEPVEQHVEAGPLAEVLQDIIEGKPVAIEAHPGFSRWEAPSYTISTGEDVIDGRGEVWLP